MIQLLYAKRKLQYRLYALAGVLLLLFTGVFLNRHRASDKRAAIVLEMIEAVSPNHVGQDRVCYIVTQYDCSLCIGSLKHWEKQIQEDAQLLQTGILYTDGEYSRSEMIEELELPRGIKWQLTSEIELFEYLSGNYPDVKPPMVVHVVGDKINFVKSVNLDSWNETL